MSVTGPSCPSCKICWTKSRKSCCSTSGVGIHTMLKFFKTLYFPNHTINLVYIWYDDRYRSKVLFNNTPKLGPNIYWTSDYGTGIVFIGSMLSWSVGAKVSCILHHRGIQLLLAYSWARPAILVAGKSRGGMFLFLLFLHFPVPLSSLSLSFISSISFLPFSGDL